MPPKAFVDFLYTPEAQTVFGNHGFRPEVAEVAAQFPDFVAAREPGHGR